MKLCTNKAIVPVAILCLLLCCDSAEQGIEQDLPNIVLLIGDDPVNDYQAATNRGWHAILIDRKSTDKARPTSQTLGELQAMLA